MIPHPQTKGGFSMVLLPTMRLSGATAILLALTSSPSPHAASSDNVIEIAIDLPFSGVSGASVRSEDEAFELAIAQANAQGLPDGVRLQTMRFDHGAPGKSFDVARAASNAKDNVANPQILAVFGTQNSKAAQAEIPILNAADLAMISATNTSSELTQRVMRPMHPDEMRLFPRLRNRPISKGRPALSSCSNSVIKPSYILDNGDTYGQGLADRFFSACMRRLEKPGRRFPRSEGRSRRVPRHRRQGQSLSRRRGLLRRRCPRAWGLSRADGRSRNREAPLLRRRQHELPTLIPNARRPPAWNSYYTVMTPNGLHLTTTIAKRFVRAFRGDVPLRPAAL